MNRLQVRFVEHRLPYGPGVTAAFSEVEARALVAQGVAEWVDEPPPDPEPETEAEAEAGAKAEADAETKTEAKEDPEEEAPKAATKPSAVGPSRRYGK